MAILYSPPKNLKLRINYGRNLRITIIPRRFWVNLMRLVVKSGVSIFNFMLIIFRSWPLPRLPADKMKNNCHRRCLGSCWDLNLTHINILMKNKNELRHRTSWNHRLRCLYCTNFVRNQYTISTKRRKHPKKSTKMLVR